MAFPNMSNMSKNMFQTWKNYCSLLLLPIQIISEIVSDMFWKLCCLVLIFCCLRPALTKASSSTHSYKETQRCIMHTHTRRSQKDKRSSGLRQYFVIVPSVWSKDGWLTLFRAQEKKQNLEQVSTLYVLDIWRVQNNSKCSWKKKACAQ